MPTHSSIPALIAGRFAVEFEAGAGGMGVVYRGLDTTSGRHVAIKVMHAADSQAAIERFLREARLLAELGHPGIVSHVDHGTFHLGEQLRPYLVMEWLDGQDLSQHLQRRGLRLSQTMLLLRRIAAALALAHRRGVVHRDLKPSNIFLRGGEPQDVALLDFGLARRAVVSRALTQTGVVVGTR
jgi:serine/threonine protein kinase